MPTTNLPSANDQLLNGLRAARHVRMSTDLQNIQLRIKPARHGKAINGSYDDAGQRVTHQCCQGVIYESKTAVLTELSVRFLALKRRIRRPIHLAGSIFAPSIQHEGRTDPAIVHLKAEAVKDIDHRCKAQQELRP